MSEYIEHDKDHISVGIVEKKLFTFAEPPHELQLDCGEKLGPVTLAYETYGTLNADRNNVVLILHALSGDSHVAGYYKPEDDKPGWWDNMVGPGKGIDTNKYFVVCTNIIGSCMGSTGPCTINPKTVLPYGLDFPVVTIGDMVKAQKVLMDYLEIEQILCVVGGSIGGMQVLEWCVRYPEMVNYFGPKPDLGLAVARMIGHITYLSDDAMRLKFGRRLQDKSDFSFNFDADFQVESYLRYQGKKFVERFDANSFLYITKAADYYDFEKQYGNGSAVEAFSKTLAKFLVISFTSDWLYPTYQSKDMVKAMKKNGLDVSFCEIEADWGHDAFLLPNKRLTALIRGFLERVAREL
jgi:homoserine O-acetyltransferase